MLQTGMGAIEEIESAAQTSCPCSSFHTPLYTSLFTHCVPHSFRVANTPRGTLGGVRAKRMLGPVAHPYTMQKTTTGAPPPLFRCLHTIALCRITALHWGRGCTSEDELDGVGITLSQGGGGIVRPLATSGTGVFFFETTCYLFSGTIVQYNRSSGVAGVAQVIGASTASDRGSRDAVQPNSSPASGFRVMVQCLVSSFRLWCC